jgi:hypothetical protein
MSGGNNLLQTIKKWWRLWYKFNKIIKYNIVHFTLGYTNYWNKKYQWPRIFAGIRTATLGVGSIEDAAEENLVVINIMDMIKKTIESKTKVGEKIIFQPEVAVLILCLPSYILRVKLKLTRNLTTCVKFSSLQLLGVKHQHTLILW